MKPMTIFITVFSGISLILFSTAFYLYQSTQSFLDSAIVADGEVIELVRSRSSMSGSSINSTTYRPRVSFQTQSGETIKFTSSTGSSPAAYDKGEKVEVYYLASNPRDADINSFFSLWGLTTIFGGLGMVFLLVPVAILLFPWLSVRKEKYLRRRGVPIVTSFQTIKLNTALTVNGKNPYHVLTEWKEPMTGEAHIFTSQNLWFDPTEEMTKEKITVFIEKDNPKKYFVDLSFLSKVEKKS